MIDRSTSEFNEAIVRRFYCELWDENKRELLDALVAEDLRFRASMGAIINGRAAFGRYIDTVHTAFPDWRHSIDELFAIDDRVITRMTWTGTHQGPLGRVEATGARVRFVGAFFRLANGVIQEGWVVGGTQELWRALGRLVQ